MMNAPHPLSQTRILLEEIASERNADHLGQCLAGQHLPLLGGNDHPADILFSALSLPPYDPDLAVALAEVTARVCEVRTEALQASSDEKSLEDDYCLFNLFLFASYLPSNRALFASLTTLYETGRQTSVLSPGRGMASRQLRQALIRQQTDATLETVWLGLIASVSRGTIHITPEEEEDLLNGWEGLLWIPPSESDRKACNIVCVPRVDAGLRALHDALHRATHGVRILRYAAGLLNDSFPRSAEFWVDCFSPYISDYPDLLRETLIEQWPMLEEEEAEIQLSPEAESTWRLFTPEEQSEVQALVGEDDPSGWNSFWENILFTAPRGHFTPQDWRSSLFLLKNELESEHPALSSDRKAHGRRSGLGMKSQAETTQRPREKRKKINSLVAFERINAVVAKIDSLLQKGDSVRAKEYFDDIIAQQEAEGTENKYIAMTLCNVATSARDTGEFVWAMELYTKAQHFNPNDAVPHAGLAETLKAMGELDEARKLYAEIVERWPNKVVPRNGLAETLKTMGELDEAEALYRKTCGNDRWKNNVIPRNGLAETLKAQGKLDETETLYRQITTRWPYDRFSRNGLANVLRKQKKYDEAFPLLTGATSFIGLQDRYDIHLRGMILLESGDVNAAIDIFESGLRANLSSTEHNVFNSALAIAKLKQRNSEEALKYINALPDLPSTEVLRLHAYAEAGDLAHVQQSHAALTSRKGIPFPTKTALKRIETAYCLKTDKICQPSPELFDEVIGAEIEMLIEAGSEMRFALAA